MSSRGEAVRGKTVWLTGAGSGLGAALAHELARQASHLLMIDRDSEALQRVEFSLRDAPCRIYPAVLDLEVVSRIPSALTTLPESVAQPDVLINCAAIEVEGTVEAVPIEAFRRSLEVNFSAPILLIKHVLPGMKERRAGQIVNISSAAARRSSPAKAAYCASKSALNAVTESLRLEVRPFGINVMLVSPGPMRTLLSANGRRYGESDFVYGARSDAQAPEVVAHKIVRHIEKRSRRMTQPSLGEIAVRINDWFPHLADALLEWRLRRRGQGAQD